MTNPSNGTSVTATGGGGTFLTAFALAVGAAILVGSSMLAAFTMGLGPLVLIALSVPLARRVSRVRTGTRDDDRPLYARVRLLDVPRHIWRQRFFGLPAGKYALIGCIASLPLAIVPWAALLGSWASIVSGLAIPVGLVAGVIVVVSAVAVGNRFRRQVRAHQAERKKFSDTLRFVAGMTEGAWTAAVWDVDTKAERLTISAPPEAVAGALRNADRIRQALPGWTVDHERSGTIAVLRPETADEARRARLAASSGGVVLDVVARGDGLYDLQLVAGTSPARAEQVEAWLQNINGLSLIEWAPLYDRAVAGPLTEEDRAMRSRIGGLLGIYAHEVTVKVTRDAEGIESLTLRAPAGRAADGETRVAQMRRVMLQTVPGAHLDWLVTVDPVTDVVTMQRRAKQVLPRRVGLDSLLPERYAPDEWANLPVGVDPQGRPVGQDLLSAPMAAVAGPTGSGKTVMLLADATQRIARGHDLVIIDPTKAGVDFASVEPYTLAFARTFEESVAAIQAAYAEGVRRKAVLLREGAVKWSDLSEEVRRVELIRPLTVLIDEAASLLIVPQVPKGLPKDHPEVVAAEKLAGQKALLSLFIGRIARELRFVGVHLVLAMQRPDASILGGEVRSNLSHRVQLIAPGKPIGRTELEMLFPSPIVGAAYDALQRFDDGESKGLAVLAGDEGNVAAIRVAFTPMQDIPALLTARGVGTIPAHRKYDLHPASATGTADPSTPPAKDDHLGDLGDLFA